MTRRTFFLPILAVWGLSLLEPILPSRFGGVTWLIDFTPLFLTYACLRLPSAALLAFLAIGSLGLDFLIPDRPGTSPLLWALVAFLVRSQHPWIGSRNWFILSLMTFAASILYAFGDRTFFLMVNDFWAWSYLLVLKLIVLALINGLLAAPIFSLMDRLCGLSRTDRSEPEFTSLYATR